MTDPMDRLPGPEQRRFFRQMSKRQRERLFNIVCRAGAAGLTCEVVEHFCDCRSLGFSWAETLNDVEGNLGNLMAECDLSGVFDRT